MQVSLSHILDLTTDDLESVDCRLMRLSNDLGEIPEDVETGIGLIVYNDDEQSQAEYAGPRLLCP